MKRICPSLISVRRRKVSRHSAGSRNGSTPSMISISAKAVSRRLPIWNVAQASRARRAGLLARLAARAEILEEIGIGLDDQHVVAPAEARLVGLEAAVERVELGVLLVGAGVDPGRLAVAIALDALRLAVGLRDDDLALAVGVGADLFRLGGAGRSQLVGHSLALGLHAAVDVDAHFLRQVHPLQ